MSTTFKPSVESFFEFNRITTGLVGELTRQGIVAGSEFVKESSEQLKTLSNSRGVEDVLAAQSAWAAKAGPRFFEHAQQAVDTVLQTSAEYTDLARRTSESFVGGSKTTSAASKTK